MEPDEETKYENLTSMIKVHKSGGVSYYSINKEAKITLSPNGHTLKVSYL